MPHQSSGTMIRPDLGAAFSEFDIEAGERGYIAPQVLPILPVAKQSGQFPRIPVEQLLKKRDVLRANGSGYSRSDWSFVEEHYATKEYGVEEPVDDREAAIYRNYFDAELESAGIAVGALLDAAERRVAGKIFNTTAFANTAVTTTWSTHATATPIADVEDAVQAVWNQCGLWPNALILTVQAFRALRQCAEIVERIESAGAGDSALAGKITTRQIAQAFSLDRCIVAGATGNSANEGQDVTFSPIWDKTMAMVARVATTPGLREPCLGRTYAWESEGRFGDGEGRVLIETYREDQIRSDVVRVRHDVDEKILYSEAGHILTGVLS